MKNKERCIFIISMLIAVFFNIVVISHYYDITKITFISMMLLGISFGMYAGILALAIYIFIKEKCIEGVVGCVISIPLVIFCNLAFITLFEVQIINVLAAIAIIIDVFYIIIMGIKLKKKK